MQPTILEQAKALEAGQTTARALIEDCLARIGDPAGEGPRAFITVYAEPARRAADAVDLLRRAGRIASPFGGIPISLKDLFDVAGEVTRAGSRALADGPPALAHAPVIARVLAAGFVPVGRTNMTEFAFSGLGINPHYGTPTAPWDRAQRHIPGGSSSGAAVSVAERMASAALGTDTGGSCRIPAALCGVVGYKPTQRRVPIEGVTPLAPSLDSVGPLAPSVACCAIVDAVLAGGAPEPVTPAPLAGLRLVVPKTVMLEGLDRAVAAAFARALSTLSAQGARIIETAFPLLEAVAEVNAKGGFAAAEAFAWHRDLIAEKGALYDPRIRARIERGAAQSAVDYIALAAHRRRLIADFDRATENFDALVAPTCPIGPPPIAALDDERDYNRVNMLLLRNTAYANFLDRCAISLPCHRPDEPPVGLMLMGETMGDRRLFQIAAAVEAALAQG